MDFVKLADDVFADVVQWRRHLHRFPELSWSEERTADWLAEKLASFGLVPRRILHTGLVVDIPGRAPHPTIALRADIDALAIDEKTGLRFASENPGAMHACGHDGHMAMLLGAARVLADLRHQIPGAVRLLFQPAEETPPPDANARASGGAVGMVADGAMDGVDAVIGMHLMPHLPVGTIGLCEGPIMSASHAFDIEITGKGGHAGIPQGSVDALATAAHVVTALRTGVAIGWDPLDPLVVHIGCLKAGTARTAVADRAELLGTLRYTRPEHGDQLRQKITRLVRQTAAGFGAVAEVNFAPHFNPPVINDDRVVAILRELGGAVFGEEQVYDVAPLLAAEDFWAYLEHAPGAYVFLGGGNPERGMTAGLHSPFFDFDEEALRRGVQVWLRAAASDAWRTLTD